MHPDSYYLKELENLSIELEKKIEKVGFLQRKILENHHQTSEKVLMELISIFELIKKSSELIKHEHIDHKNSVINFLDKCYLDDEN